MRKLMFRFLSVLRAKSVQAMTSVFFAVVFLCSAMGEALAAEPQQNMLSQWMSSMIETRWGQYSLIAIFFFFIIIYLRVLFGPKGLFREKKWDEWNEQARERETMEREKRVEGQRK